MKYCRRIDDVSDKFREYWGGIKPTPVCPVSRFGNGRVHAQRVKARYCTAEADGRIPMIRPEAMTLRFLSCRDGKIVPRPISIFFSGDSSFFFLLAVYHDMAWGGLAFAVEVATFARLQGAILYK